MYGPDHKGMEPQGLKQLTKFRDEISRCLGFTENSENSEDIVENSYVL